MNTPPVSSDPARVGKESSIMAELNSTNWSSFRNVSRAHDAGQLSIDLVRDSGCISSIRVRIRTGQPNKPLWEMDFTFQTMCLRE